MMEPPLEDHEIVEEGTEIGNEEEQPVNEVSGPLLVEAEWPGIENKETVHSKTPFMAKIFRSISTGSQSSLPEVEPFVVWRSRKW